MGLGPNTPIPATSRLAEEEQERERKKPQERENEEMKEALPLSPAPSPAPSVKNSPGLEELETTRHLARMATIEDHSSLALQRVVLPLSRHPSTWARAAIAHKIHLARSARATLNHKAQSTMRPWNPCSVRSSLPRRQSKRTVCLLWTRPRPRPPRRK
jgi:hypothetical protein